MPNLKIDNTANAVSPVITPQLTGCLTLAFKITTDLSSLSTTEISSVSFGSGTISTPLVSSTNALTLADIQGPNPAATSFSGSTFTTTIGMNNINWTCFTVTSPSNIHAFSWWRSTTAGDFYFMISLARWTYSGSVAVLPGDIIINTATANITAAQRRYTIRRTDCSDLFSTANSLTITT